MKPIDELTFIRAEGLIPRPSGAKQGVLNPTAIPYENTIPRCSAAGLVIDDYMFGEVMKPKEICIGVLERLTGLEIEDIEYPELQKSLKPGYETHGIRLDVYVKIEMQSTT